MHTPSPTPVASKDIEQPTTLTWRVDEIGFTRSAETTADGFNIAVYVKPGPLGWMRYGIQQLGQFSKVKLRGAIRHFPQATDLLDDSTWFIPATRFEDLVDQFLSDSVPLEEAQNQASGLINCEYDDAAHYGRRWSYVTVTVQLSIDTLSFMPVHMNGLRSDDDNVYFDLVANELIDTASTQAKSHVSSLTQHINTLSAANAD